MRVCTGGSRLMGISLLRFPLLQYFKKFHKYLPTLDSGINVGVRLLFFEKNGRKKNMKNDGNALIDVKMN